MIINESELETEFEEDFYRYGGIFGQGVGYGSAPWGGSAVVG